jgi:CBS domain-containing protein
MLLTVEDVMVRNVVAISSDETVKNAASTMIGFEIGSLVVLEEDRVVGMITERDILGRVVTIGRDPEKTTVKEVMSQPAVVVGPALPLDKAVALMFEYKIKKLPVIERSREERKLVGIVTLTDIARLHPQLIKTLKELFDMNKEKPPRRMQKVIDYYIV